MAGLYAGWSLLTRTGNDARYADVTIFEQDKRIGGRLHTMAPPHAPHLRCELGGMRYIDTQDLVVDLIAELGLASHLFPVGDEHDLFYLKGERFDLGEFKAKTVRAPYDLKIIEEGMSPPELMAGVLRRWGSFASTFHLKPCNTPWMV